LHSQAEKKKELDPAKKARMLEIAQSVPPTDRIPKPAP